MGMKLKLPSGHISSYSPVEYDPHYEVPFLLEW